MKKINYFKRGVITGIGIGAVVLILGFFAIQKIAEQAENVDQLDLHQLEYMDMDGNPLALSDFEGKNVLVNFWATWCAPCVKEFPILNETYGSVEKDFVFLMVSDESIDKIKAFAEDQPYEFVYAKTKRFILNGITSVPQTFVFDKDGNKRHHHPSIFEGEAEAISDTLQLWVAN